MPSCIATTTTAKESKSCEDCVNGDLCECTRVAALTDLKVLFHKNRRRKIASSPIVFNQFNCGYMQMGGFV